MSRQALRCMRTVVRELGRDRCPQSQHALIPGDCSASKPVAGVFSTLHARLSFANIASQHSLRSSSCVAGLRPSISPMRVPLGSRLYKIASTGLVDIPEQVFAVNQNRRSTDFMAYQECSNRLVVDINQARMPAAWKRQRFYIKPKQRRHMHKWNGIVKRKRRDFNTRLRWALKSMSRCVSSYWRDVLRLAVKHDQRTAGLHARLPHCVIPWKFAGVSEASQVMVLC